MKLSDVFTLIVLSFLVVSLIGFFFDRPILVSYVTSDSMEPTLNRGDMFFINPLSKGSPGDIAVFKMAGSWTVHRIYAEGEDGYITKGDANVATDQQEGRAPPIKRNDVAGTVLTIADRPIKVPGVGGYISEFSQRGSALYAAIALLIMGALVITSDESGKKHRSRHRRKLFFRVKFKTLYAATGALMIALLLISMMLSWGDVTFTYSSTLAGGQREGWYLPGSVFEDEITLKNAAVYPFVYFIVPQGERFEVTTDTHFRLSGNTEERIGVKVHVPEDTRIYRETIKVYAYLPILPEGVIAYLYNRNPYLPFVAYILETGAFLVFLYSVSGLGNEDVIRYRRRKSGLLNKLREAVGL
ncbi:signal peptidase I [Palaeococcus ferrophilus]|uniref:signal peptidase I n=1 Tax=Palaeococcus ferrophilus TaxID=83868 RepID=UPI00064F3086|nr:signal peptidase I [Palaeococcus ferrophilus]